MPLENSEIVLSPVSGFLGALLSIFLRKSLGMNSSNVYDFIFLACFDLFSILHFFSESKLVLGLFSEELFENVLACFVCFMI